uniref:Uncharacterized protein n=1 Tax=Timema tahoe TaxID=61484 RepID=A0A7R9FG08_9NEOP|nr:unnamed protein product [Timema tahoe]
MSWRNLIEGIRSETLLYKAARADCSKNVKAQVPDAKVAPYISPTSVCLICFLVGLIFCTGAGEYWLTLFDSFAGTIGLVLVALLETLAVMYVYGHEKFTQDIEDMTGYRPGLYWQITWRLLGPLLMLCVLVSSVLNMILEKPHYKAWDANKGMTVEAAYPDWVMVVAILMITAGVLPIIIVFLLRRFQCLKLDVSIHQGAIRRIDTTVSTKEMMGDVDIYSSVTKVSVLVLLTEFGGRPRAPVVAESDQRLGCGGGPLLI